MTLDPYATAAAGWAIGAELVYGPIATALVNQFPDPVAGRVVLDAGAGTGAASRVLAARGARPISVDRSAGMLAANLDGVVGDLRALPFTDHSVDGSVAAFVLNHLSDPAAGLAELRRVTRPGGTVLATTFSNTHRHPARDQLDALAVKAGLCVPDWYSQLKATAAATSGTPDLIAAAARSAGLVDITTSERPVDVGVSEPEQLVRHRLAQPLFAAWLRGLGPTNASAFAQGSAAAIAPLMTPYRPVVVFLIGRVPAQHTG